MLLTLCLICDIKTKRVLQNLLKSLEIQLFIIVQLLVSDLPIWGAQGKIGREGHKKEI